MFYQSELRFLCDTFKKCRVQVSFTTPCGSAANLIDDGFKILFGEHIDEQLSFNDRFGKLEPRTIYKSTTPFKLCHLFFLLPQTPQETLLVIGPYMPSPLTDKDLLEIGEKYNITLKKQQLLESYYGNIPLITESSHVFAMLDTFGERIWGGSNAFSLVDLNQELRAAASPISEHEVTEDLEDVLLNMKIMEERYAYENKLIQAVTQGQIHKVDLIMSGFSAMSFEKRLADPLRDLKNYSIIMNTLLRKAAENGGVHPVYLNSASSSFAAKIEQLSSTDDVLGLMLDMFRSYCRLVRKHSMKGYSATVQKTIVFIESDLSANLSLSSLAAVQNVSAGYLSTVFKKETGKTVTDYINSKRVSLAMHLLSTTRLQIQTIALHCGIMDVHYFSKVFKKYTGKTPREYRELVK